jgi:hypothetical protein
MISGQGHQDVSKKRAERTGTPVLVRFQDPTLQTVEAWPREQPDLPSRPEAIHRLVEIGLKAKR